jgi:hypothetical protein
MPVSLGLRLGINEQGLEVVPLCLVSNLHALVNPTRVLLKKLSPVVTSIGLASSADDDDTVEFIHPQDLM